LDSNSANMNILSVLVGTSVVFTNVVGSAVFNINADKLLNFSTSYSVSGNHIPYGYVMTLDNLLATGNIQFDLLGEQLKITMGASLTIQKGLAPYAAIGLPKYFTGATQTGSSTIYLDGKLGKMAFGATATTKKGLYSVSESACVQAKVPIAYYSSVSMLKPRLAQYVTLVNQSLNQLPFTVADGVASLSSRSYRTGVEMKLKLDGTPISFRENQTEYQYNSDYTSTAVTGLLAAEFTNFVKGAGTLTGITCAEGSSTVLSSNPGIVHSIALAEHLIAHLSDSNPAFGEFASKFPQLSELFPQMMMEEPEPDSMPWAVVLVSFVCGAGLVLLLVKFSSSATTMRREPLLEMA